ncbi:MAG: hypothetical protein ABF652_19845 [Clostridium beijerinckii]|nr:MULTISPECIES: hypothetical protein [Clostridium]
MTAIIVIVAIVPMILLRTNAIPIKDSILPLYAGCLMYLYGPV